MKFLGLITRCKDEFFVNEFCNYYLMQGVDEIFIIDDNSEDKTIYDNIDDDRINVIYENNLFNNKHQMEILNNYYKEIKNKFTWMISVDIDEFITTKKNIKNTIRNELETNFKNVDCIKIPWVMMSSNNKKTNPKSILIENTYRWNHNKKHPHKIRKFRCRYKSIEVKCIFKTSKFKYIDIHYPHPIGQCIVINSIDKKEDKLNSFYENLRENDIKNGILLCYHYRIISNENNIKKLKKKTIY